ncbi:MAG: hypothetical protein Kow00109_04670 [Acidobacteriota bacterium]
MLLSILWLLSGPLPALAEPCFFTLTLQERNGIYVRDLEPAELEVRLDGRPVPVGYLGRQDVEAAFVVVLENSPRTAQYLRSMPQWGRVNIVDQIRWGLQQSLLDALTASGPVWLGQFFEELETLQDFTSAPEPLIHALYELEPRPSGIVFNNIPVGRILAHALDLLRSRTEKRKGLLFIFRTVDADTYQHREEYAQMFRQSDVDLYLVAFAPRFLAGRSGTPEERMTGAFCRSLARETGGHAWVAEEFRYIDELFTEIQGRMTAAYTVGLRVDPEEPPREHRLEVKVRRKGCRVFHRPVLIY